jgi:hypothetical protein
MLLFDQFLPVDVTLGDAAGPGLYGGVSVTEGSTDASAPQNAVAEAGASSRSTEPDGAGAAPEAGDDAASVDDADTDGDARSSSAAVEAVVDADGDKEDATDELMPPATTEQGSSTVRQSSRAALVGSAGSSSSSSSADAGFAVETASAEASAPAVARWSPGAVAGTVLGVVAVSGVVAVAVMRHQRRRAAGSRYGEATTSELEMRGLI